ncbi:MAG: hypothetical protein H6925_04370 [Holosporaceae bacterium]|nr:MAG: hypothetical protein H6925_04370 [Holosporaceae bacterium]
MPQYDAARTSRPALTAALQDQIKAGKQLRKVSPTSSKQRQEGRGALLDAIRKGKELRKTQGPNANRAKSTNPLFG